MRCAILFSVILNFFCIAVINFPWTEGQECPSDKDKDWSWDPKAPNGPSHWGDQYPDCNGKKQSPIDILTKSVEKGKESGGLQLTNYDKAIKKATIKNLGYLVTITPTDDVERSVEHNGNTYNLREFHFHWGHPTETSGTEHSSPGSEHSLSRKKGNPRRYAMEIHLAHYDSSDNLVIVAGFIGETGANNPAIDEILETSNEYAYAGDESEVSYGMNDTGIDLENFVRKGCPYYTYEGSNTFPPCKEGVTWMICNQVALVDTSGLFKLEDLYSVKRDDPNADKCRMVDIYRPTQKLNGRKVYSG